MCYCAGVHELIFFVRNSRWNLGSVQSKVISLFILASTTLAPIQPAFAQEADPGAGTSDQTVQPTPIDTLDQPTQDTAASTPDQTISDQNITPAADNSSPSPEAISPDLSYPSIEGRLV